MKNDLVFTLAPFFSNLCPSNKKVKQILTFLYSECIKMSILRLKKSYEKESHSVKYQSTETFLRLH